ncbi:ceramidase domain-containing protein [Microvirga lotononidis]|uniref:Alkaline phytoceramidase (APHC) n=1 Tax=Microvirga lotononidis TaxID=864069 RepID=I4YKQ6_9HYPH|nr:ceramidase domain-containing protein [Microvirga lotononidis]EIM24548.1 Alkaline phytoceramidase (aPHC) [Microvirga lotononidis]WQO26567.1 ceramidase domain-containing protein [Microvirga lotononidis]
MPGSWLTPIDSYCERLGPGFWAEPLNAATNAAFIAAAFYAFLLWRRAGARDWPSLWLIAVTFVVGTGSFLFHTFANRWSLLADVLPIAVFIYSYFLLAMRRYLSLGWAAATAATGLFLLFNLSFDRLWFSVLPGVTLNGSVGYIPAALALLAVGVACRLSQAKAAGLALLVAAGVFALSLYVRSIDEAVCAAMPAGTHFLWHMLNALVLGILMRAAIVHSSRKGPVFVQD